MIKSVYWLFLQEFSKFCHRGIKRPLQVSCFLAKKRSSFYAKKWSCFCTLMALITFFISFLLHWYFYYIDIFCRIHDIFLSHSWYLFITFMISFYRIHDIFYRIRSIIQELLDRNLPRAALSGIFISTVFFILCNISYFVVLEQHEILDSPAIAMVNNSDFILFSHWLNLIFALILILYSLILNS